MTETLARGRAALLTLRTVVAIGAISFAVAGCSAAAPVGAPSGTDDIIPDVVDQADPGGDAGGSNDGQATVIGAELTTSIAATIAEVYAESRDPIPTVEFLDATTVRFSWAAGLTESEALSNCQIAYGALSGEGIRVLIAVGDAEADCTAEVEG